MTFADLKSAVADYRALLRDATGRDLVASVTVDEPSEPPDELHFFKLVSWCYVLLYEASQPSTRYLLSLLRAADPSEHKAVSAVLENVGHLRTVRVHNLSEESKRDDFRRTQAKIWLFQNGGEPTDWSNCCGSLCAEAADAIRLLTGKWRRVTTSAEDAAAVVADLVAVIDREWPAHAFDRIVEDAACELDLRGFDGQKYRQHRLDAWRELVGFFEDRTHAEAAISSAIRLELERTFGLVQHPGQA